MTTKPTKQPPPGRPDPPLRDLVGMAAQMRSLEQQRAAIAEKRRKRVIYYHSQNVSCAAMARAMDITEAAVNKILHGPPSRKAKAQAQS